MADIDIEEYIKKTNVAFLKLATKINIDKIIELLVKNGLKEAYDYFEQCDKIGFSTTWNRTTINKNKSDIKDKLIDLMKYVVKYYIDNTDNISKHPNYSTYIEAKENEFRGHNKINITIDNFLDDENIKGYEDDFKDDIINKFKPELTNKIAEINNLIDKLKTLCNISTGGKKSRKQRRRRHRKSSKHRKSRHYHKR